MSELNIDYEKCPCCEGERVVSIQVGDGWAKHRVACDGIILDPDDQKYESEPCGLLFEGYVNEVEAEDLIKNWDHLVDKVWLKE